MYAARFGLVVLLGTSAACLALCALLASDLGSYGQNVTIIRDVRKWVVGASVLSALIQVAFTGVLVSVLALLASHKVAGPMVRLVGHLRGVAEGRLPGPVAFRRGDQVGRVESHFNDVSRLIRERQESLERKAHEAQSAVGEFLRALRGGGSREARRAAAKEVRERAGELAALLAKMNERREPGAIEGMA